MSDTKKILIAVAAGVAIGAIAGVLFSSDKGKAIRKKILDEGENLADTLKEKISVCKGTCQNVKEGLG